MRFINRKNNRQRHNSKIGMLLSTLLLVTVVFTGCQQEPGKQNSNSTEEHYYNDNTGLAQNPGQVQSQSQGQSSIVSTPKIYSVYFGAYFAENILNLETYYVEIIIDGETLDTMERGHTLTATYRLSEGSHTILFKMTCKDKPTVSEEIKKVVNITDNTDIEARFACKNYRLEMNEWKVS